MSKNVRRSAGLMSACLAAPLLLASVAASPAAGSHDVAPARGTSRVLLVFAPSRSDRRYAEQTQVLDADKPGAAERNLVLVSVIGAGGETADGEPGGRLRSRYGVPQGGFAVLLIGKDGGAKLRSDRPISLTKLFAAIDAMPMRQAEMR